MESPYLIVAQRARKPAKRAKARRPGKLVARRLATAVTLPPLPTIADAKFLKPGNADYATYLPLHNKRNDAQPALRIMCTSTQAVADCIKWVRDNGLPLALRSGGHCYEGFSQSDGVVIDIRRMGLVTVDAAQKIVTVSGGASLGKVYREVAKAGFAFAAGSCPTVGVSGHALGGGMGLLGRRFGLACDNLVSVRIVDANGAIRTASAQNDADLFWACRGGGGGSFGVATRFQFKIHPLANVHTFRVVWTFANTSAALAKAAQVFNAWQTWAPGAPQSITAIVSVQKTSEGKLMLRCIGQSTGTKTELQQQINSHVIVQPPTTALQIVQKTFIKAVEGFAGSGGFTYNPVFMKAKSDFVAQPLSNAGIRKLFDEILKLPAGNVAALCDAYGGAIANLGATATAFPHRGAATYCIQYYSQWSSAATTAVRLARIKTVYDAMRPFVGNAAYVNYCDIYQPNHAAAYWGANLPKLKQIKQAVDPANLFRHAQSIPLP
jgi:FAD/FMN-containing dehydrogenase